MPFRFHGGGCLGGAKPTRPISAKASGGEIAAQGVGKGSKVSEPVESILLTEAIEIIPTTEDGEANLRAAAWGTK